VDNVVLFNLSVRLGGLTGKHAGAEYSKSGLTGKVESLGDCHTPIKNIGVRNDGLFFIHSQFARG